MKMRCIQVLLQLGDEVFLFAILSPEFCESAVFIQDNGGEPGDFVFEGGDLAGSGEQDATQAQEEGDAEDCESDDYEVGDHWAAPGAASSSM